MPDQSITSGPLPIHHNLVEENILLSCVMTITIVLNGQPKALEAPEQVSLANLVTDIGFKPDRVAIEHNGIIAPRSSWTKIYLTDADRVELVHFVGGGAPVSS